MSLRNRFKLGLQFRLSMSQGCSILVLVVKNYQEGIYRRETNPSPDLIWAKARLPEGGGKGRVKRSTHFEDN